MLRDVYSWCYGLKLPFDLHEQMIQYIVDRPRDHNSEFSCWLEEKIHQFHSDILYFERNQTGQHIIEEDLAGQFWLKWFNAEESSVSLFNDEWCLMSDNPLQLDNKGIFKVIWSTDMIDRLTDQSRTEFPPTPVCMEDHWSMEEQIRLFKSEFPMEIQTRFPELQYFWRVTNVY